MIDDSTFQERTPPDFREPEATVEETPAAFSFGRLLTYPLNRPGLTVLGLYALVPFLLEIAATLISSVLPLLILVLGFVVLVVHILITLSTFWYLTVCIRASAEGQTKAPDLFEFSQDDSFWDWLREFFLVLITVCLCLGPAFALKRFADVSDIVFWSILGVGVFFLPMCLLAIVMFDTINALNPLLIIASVFSTFFSYVLIVVLFFVPLALVAGLLFFSLIPLLSVPIKAIGLYLLMMDACLLGRFFYRNEEKLRWDV